MKKRPAATLIEIMLYFTLLASFMTVAILFSLQIINASHQVATESDLSTEMSLIRSRLISEILSADSINFEASTLDSATSVLVFNVGIESIQISLSGTDLVLQKGSETPVALNSPALTFETLEISVYSADKAPDHIVLDAQVSVPSELDTLDAETQLHIALSLRP